MAAKSKSAHKKKKVSKHVLKAREEISKDSLVPDAIATVVAPAVETTTGKRKQRKNRRIKDPSEAATYLEEWKQQSNNDGSKSTWKFNKNTQSWLIRHMYEADKVSKGVFTLLLEYLAGLEGKTTRSWIRTEASRRALRYKNFEKQEKTDTKKTSDTKEESEAKDKALNEKTGTDDEREDQARWELLDEHDKRKEYKRARKILETISE